MPNMRWHLTLSEFAQGELPDKIHAALIERALGGRMIGAIARSWLQFLKWLLAERSG